MTCDAVVGSVRRDRPGPAQQHARHSFEGRPGMAGGGHLRGELMTLAQFRRIRSMKTTTRALIASAATAALVIGYSAIAAPDNTTGGPRATFGTPTVVDFFHPGYEPDLAVAKAGKYKGSTYASVPNGFSTTISYLWRSDDNRRSQGGKEQGLAVPPRPHRLPAPDLLPGAPRQQPPQLPLHRGQRTRQAGHLCRRW